MKKLYPGSVCDQENDILGESAGVGRERMKFFLRRI